MLCKLIQYHQPAIKFTGLNEKAIAKNACVANIEKGLAEMWKNKAKRHNLPSAEEIFLGKPQDKIWIFLKEVYDVFAMHDVEIWLKYTINQWATQILDHYELAFSKESTEFPYNGLYNDLKDGKILYSICHYFLPKLSRPNFSKLYKNPSNSIELSNNLKFAFELSESLELPIWWTPEEFLQNPKIHIDFVKQQLYYIYKKLKDFKGNSPTTDELIYLNEIPLQDTIPENSSSSNEKEKILEKSEEEIPQGMFSQPIIKKIAGPSAKTPPPGKKSISEIPEFDKKLENVQNLLNKMKIDTKQVKKEEDKKNTKEINISEERKKMQVEEKFRIKNEVVKKDENTGNNSKNHTQTHVTNQTAHFAGDQNPDSPLEAKDQADNFKIISQKNTPRDNINSNNLLENEHETPKNEDNFSENEENFSEKSLDLSGLDEEMKDILRSEKDDENNDKDENINENIDNNSPKSDNYDSIHETVVDPNFLLSYLMTPQILQLSVNKGKFHPFMFKLVPSPLVHMYFQQHYYFVWTDLETSSVVSSLDITHIKDVRRLDNQCCFSVILFTSHALAKGETSNTKNPLKMSDNQDSSAGSINNSFIVKCETLDDCYKYVTGLNYFAEEVRAEFGAMSPSVRKSLRRELALRPVPAAID